MRRKQKGTKKNKVIAVEKNSSKETKKHKVTAVEKNNSKEAHSSR